MNHARSFVILHEDQPNGSCKFFREDCEILFDYLVCGCMGRSKGGVSEGPPLFFHKYCKKNE